MGFVYEVVLNGEQAFVPIASVFHVWDGDELQTPDDVADVFENNYLADLVTSITDQLSWYEILVTALDASNPADAIKRAVDITGTLAGDPLPVGNHCWVKFLSADNGFKAGGKLIPGINETISSGNLLSEGYMDGLQTVFEDLMADLIVQGLFLAIFRPTLSTPGFPQVSMVADVLVKGLGSNNRRQRVTQR